MGRQGILLEVFPVEANLVVLNIHSDVVKIYDGYSIIGQCHINASIYISVMT